MGVVANGVLRRKLGSGTVAPGGVFDPHTGAIGEFLQVPPGGLGSGANPGGRGGDGDGDGGGGGRRPQPEFPLGISYNSQVNMNRMTGNWWFAYDIFVVAQPNGDLLYYAPGLVGAVYSWDPVTQTFTSPPGAFDTMTANGDGTWTRTTKHGEQWHFGTSGHLLWTRNRYGLQTTLNRDGQNRITSITDYANRSRTVQYNAHGYVTSITDWGGRSVSFTYDQNGYLTTVTYPATRYWDWTTNAIVNRGMRITLQYTSGTGTQQDGNLTSMVDDVGNTILSNSYDAMDRATASTSRGRGWQYQYLAGGLTKVVDPDGITTVYSFNAGGGIIRKEIFTQTGLGQPPLRAGEPNSYVWLYERNAACGCDLITKVTRPDGSTTSYTYDSWGNMLSLTRSDAPGGGGPDLKETWTWSSFAQYCQLLTSVSPVGNAPGATAADYTTTRQHDASGSLTSITYPKAEIQGTPQHPVVSITRNTAGQPLEIT